MAVQLVNEALDWGNLSFKPRQTKGIVVSLYDSDKGEWSPLKISDDFNFTFSVFGGVFHYGNSAFEGLKAFRGKDGKVRLFRPDENALRLQRSAARIGMPAPSVEMFTEACVKCVEENIDYLPPYGYGSSMYIRPVLLGVNPLINIEPSKDVMFCVMCTPVGTYTGGKFLAPGTAVISRNYDRAAPNGTGAFKLSANYATSLYPYVMAHQLGYQELLFLDPATKTKIDEFGSSNFIGIKGAKYITPLSDSVLPSITNKSLQQVARDLGLTVEKRIVPVEELAEFDEINACGTAVVISPIKSVSDKPALESDVVTKTWNVPSGDECGKTSRKLYDHIRGIQDGIVEDVHGWCLVL